MYKVRFNLGRGKNYKTWKVENLADKTSQNYQPDEVSLTLVNCTLKNSKVSAEKIFSGSNKFVCAWILCERVLIDAPREDVKGVHLRYNPRVTPNWCEEGEDVDGKEYEFLITENQNVINII
jgi:hypothetical protein